LFGEEHAQSCCCRFETNHGEQYCTACLVAKAGRVLARQLTVRGLAARRLTEIPTTALKFPPLVPVLPS
jgi:hypothetical protein